MIEGLQIDYIESLLNKALDRLYKDDSYLIMIPSELAKISHVGERAIVFRFGIYLQQLLDECGIFEGYNLDCEYNRNGLDPKFIDDKRVIPDLILHKRGRNDKNILILEFKGWWNQDQSEDRIKIERFTDPKGKYRYQFGFTVLIGKENPELQSVL